jgi:hypothetical protein
VASREQGFDELEKLLHRHCRVILAPIGKRDF